jgi:SAM-dependent methyltransferase
MESWKRYWQLLKFYAEFRRVENEVSDGRFSCHWEDSKPCLSDATATTSFDAHYLYHTAWAARLVSKIHPQKHVDIGSCMRFSTIASAFVPMEFYDYRPATINLPGLVCGQADLTRLPFESDTIESLSCMHVVEHIGLMRYGDPFDPKGDLKAIRELCRVVAKGGHLLFVVPVGALARIQYNAHRIYTYRQVVGYLERESLQLAEFSLVLDSGVFVPNATEKDADGQRYGCGCFHLVK